MPDNDTKSTKVTHGANQKILKNYHLLYNPVTIHVTQFYDDESNRRDDRGNQRQPVLRKLLALIPPRKLNFDVNLMRLAASLEDRTILLFLNVITH